MSDSELLHKVAELEGKLKGLEAPRSTNRGVGANVREVGNVVALAR